ncbi:hypothetical protein [Tateyamaria sp. syn59]|uniref:hypothetical protein n=1 Tax=Tateyamaria sp. syn59 TaxID=2576942 RepID=UPI0011BDC587|nr:hypothetical protein [Tateyamaria sp. syn59]
MSFVWQYNRFLRVAFDDDNGDAVTSLVCKPTAPTRKIMENHALVFRSEPAGFSVFSRASPEAADPLIAPISDRIRLSFGVALQDRQFFSRYHPDLSAAGRQILLENLDAGGAIRLSGALSAGDTVEQTELVHAGPASAFPVTIDLTGGSPDRVRARDRFDNTQLLEQLFSPPPGPSLQMNIDLQALPHPAARLTTPVPGALDQQIYADNEIARSGVPVILDLWWDQRQDTVPVPAGAEFTATFRNRLAP